MKTVKSVKFERNGQENGKTAYLVKRRAVGSFFTYATIVFDGRDWVLRRLSSGRVDRFERLRDARQEALKL